MLKSRISKLFGNERFSSLPAVLLTGQPDIFYFTNFTGCDSWVLLMPKKTIIITDGRYTIQAAQESPDARVVVRKGPILKYLTRILKQYKLETVGVFREEITLHLMDRLSESNEGVQFEPVSNSAVCALREQKDTLEIGRIKRAVRIAETSFLDMLETVHDGITEAELAAEIEYNMRLNGAEKSAFDIIVACGANSSKPHAKTSSNRLKANKPIVIDFGAMYKSYCSDLTRTIWLGRMPGYFRKIYEVCLEAQLEGIASVKPGVLAKEVDNKARRIISRAGLGKYFNHSLGHGFGLDVHELPTLGSRQDVELRPGMVITVEPGIYIPGKGGIRIEDDVLVTKTGCKVLSSLPKMAGEVIF